MNKAITQILKNIPETINGLAEVGFSCCERPSCSRTFIELQMGG